MGLRPALRLRVLRAATWVYKHFRTDGAGRSGLRILMYHAVGTPIVGDVRFLYNMPPARFETHMRHLAERCAGQIVPLSPSALDGHSFKIALTFDDGYRDNLSVAAPLLVDLGIPFTVFMSTGPVARREPGFLGPEAVRELARVPGATIGAHSVSHPRLTACDDRRLREELVGSKAYLEDLIGAEVDSVSYPHGAVDRRVRDAAEAAGYRIGASSRFDINRAGRDPLLLCRTDIWAEDDRPTFEEKLRGDWDWNRWRSADPAAKYER
jgi:peptidoglycan/xylan/chitin deacetylase (PgdA/CDA1 family)